MPDKLIVLVGESVAGTLERLSRGRLRFAYEDTYRERASSTPLSLSMPKEVRTHPDSVITPWLWGLLPDNERVLARWARQFHVSAGSPFSFLATPIGEDCAGAVRFVTPENLDAVLARQGEITWLTEPEVAERLAELKRDSTAWLGGSFTGQFSLAGAQAKTALFREEERWGIPSGPLPTTHILKPAVAGLDDHDLNEHLCMQAARLVGIRVARTSVGRFDNQSAIVIDRYDRIRREGSWQRVHQEDLCQALGYPPDRKYQNEGGPSPPEIVTMFRSAMPAEVAEDAVARFLDALIWNWLIAGTDAHAKNYSVLLASNDVRLAPLYDVVSALPYDMHERSLRLAMKIGDDYRVFPYHDAWPGAARQLGLDEGVVMDRVRTLARLVGDAFAEAAAAPEVVALDRPLPRRLAKFVAERATRCLAILDVGSAAREAG